MHKATRNYGKAAGTVALALACALGLFACSNTSEHEKEPSTDVPASSRDAGASYKTITPDEGQALMNDEQVVIVDVRTPEEYAEQHIPGAVNIPVESIGTEKPTELADVDAELVVYCRTGVRSKHASDKLIALGYRHVNDMGGIVDWKGATVTGTEPGTPPRP